MAFSVDLQVGSGDPMRQCFLQTTAEGWIGHFGPISLPLSTSFGWPKCSRQLSYLAAFRIYDNFLIFWAALLDHPTVFLYSMTINLLSDVQYDNLTSSLMFNDNSALMLTVLWDLLANIQFRWHIYGTPLHGW